MLCYDGIRTYLSLCVFVCPYSHSMGLFELADLLNLIHEISSVYVLHDKIQAVLRRDGGADTERKREVIKCMFIKAGERSQRNGLIVRTK